MPHSLVSFRTAESRQCWRRYCVLTLIQVGEKEHKWNTYSHPLMQFSFELLSVFNIFLHQTAVRLRRHKCFPDSDPRFCHPYSGWSVFYHEWYKRLLCDVLIQNQQTTDFSFLSFFSIHIHITSNRLQADWNQCVCIPLRCKDRKSKCQYY